MQQQGGGGSQYRVPSSSEMAAPTRALRTQMVVGVTTDNPHQQQQQQQVVEEASPISSRPPAGNFDELAGDEDLLAGGDETDHRGGISGGNRWPRQETLALLKIRSEMDITFRDASLKGPLWEEVSRKLGELGYTRSAKKCKEKFENVQKYYKRTKEGRAGRQDGKSYRFFSQLEALHGTAGTSIGTTSNIGSVSPAPAAVVATRPSSAKPAPISIGSSDPMPISSVRNPPILSAPSQTAPIMGASQVIRPPDLRVSMAPATITQPAAGGISFSSTSSSSASESEDDGDELEPEPSNPSSSRGRKRKRVSAKGGINNRMMEFFESLMRQVMQKQEAMQQRFLDTIEKREHDRMIREEAWKRQEMSRMAREHELLAQDRAIAASRDAAIIDFLQKITGQNIQLPTTAPAIIPTVPITPPPATVPPQQQQPPPPPPPPPPQQQQHRQQPQQHQGQQHHQQQLHQYRQSPNSDPVIRLQPPPPNNSDVVMAVPEQQVAPQDTSGGGGSFDPTSSRWPKVEVLALIKLRSGLEARYQETGPKGPLWEDISAGMQQMGYKRNAKRCKEKWENINKYFKKVKESNKTRPEDAKTCPYFHELDALYRKKILGGGTSGGAGGEGSSGSSFGNQNMPVQQQQQQQPESMATNTQEQDRSNLAGIMAAPQATVATDGTIVQANNRASLFGQGSNTIKNAGGGHKKPEDIVKELIEQQQQLMAGDYDKVGELDHSDDIDEDEDEDENADDESEEEMKMAYKIEFQPKQNAGPSNRGGNGTPSFMAMVQ